MRRSDPGESLGQNRGPKGENPADSKTSRQKRSASSGFVPVYFEDLTSSVDKELDFHLYSIERKLSGENMRDKSQTITTKESGHAEVSELPLKPVKFASESDLQIIKDTYSSSVSPLKPLDMPPLVRTCPEQDWKLPKHKSTKKSSKRAWKEKADEQEVLPSTDLGVAVSRTDGHQILETASKPETASTPKIISKGRRRWRFSDVKCESVSELDTDIIDTSTPKSTSTSKNGKSSPDVAVSPALPTPDSSRLPKPKRKWSSRFSESPDHSAAADSSFTLRSNKSLSNASFDSISPKTNTNNSYSSETGCCSADPLANLMFSSPSFANGSFSSSPRTPKSFNDTEMQQWKRRRGMSDIGPLSYQNLAWRDNVRGVSDTLHASLLDTPPYPQRRERLMNNSHLLPKRYSHAPVEKYHSFQHKTHLAAKTSDWKTSFLNQCYSLKNKFIDSHCHLDFLFDRLPFEGSFQKYYRNNLDTFPSNFAGCVAVFCEPKSFTSEGLWKLLLNDDMVWLAMGCHPKKATAFDEAAEEGLRACIQRPEVVAVGEIGLDYSGRFDDSAETQKRVFVCQIKMALSVKKPLVIHCRDAQDDCLRILKKYVPCDYRIHCHCFTKSFDLAKEWLDYFPNLYIGLTPLVTYSSAKEVHDTARKIPLERLLLETDAPYFVPRLVPRGTMKLSHPGLAISVAFEVAKLKGTNVETVLKHCLENTKTMYGIKE